MTVPLHYLRLIIIYLLSGMPINFIIFAYNYSAQIVTLSGAKDLHPRGRDSSLRSE